MRTFAELEVASDEMIESVLRNVDRTLLATALQGASGRLIDRILGRRSTREIEQVLHEIARQQAATLSEIEAARQQIAHMTEELETAGISL